MACRRKATTWHFEAFKIQRIQIMTNICLRIKMNHNWNAQGVIAGGPGLIGGPGGHQTNTPFFWFLLISSDPWEERPWTPWPLVHKFLWRVVIECPGFWSSVGMKRNDFVKVICCVKEVVWRSCVGVTCVWFVFEWRAEVMSNGGWGRGGEGAVRGKDSRETCEDMHQ